MQVFQGFLLAIAYRGCLFSSFYASTLFGFGSALFISSSFWVGLDLLQVSLLINKQTGGKKKKRDGKMEGERDLWTTHFDYALCIVS